MRFVFRKITLGLMDDVLERGAVWKGYPDTKMLQSELLDYSSQQGLSKGLILEHMHHSMFGCRSCGWYDRLALDIYSIPLSVEWLSNFFFTQPLVRKYFTLQSIHTCVRHKTEITLGWCPLQMLFCSILLFSVLWWFTDDESWSPQWKPLLYNSAGKRKTIFSHPLQLEFPVFSALQTQRPCVAFAISVAKHAVEVFGLSWQCQQRLSH